MCGNELGQEGQAEQAHLVDNDKEGHFLLGQQQAIGGSQMGSAWEKAPGAVEQDWIWGQEVL